jgi:hypothetical protein
MPSATINSGADTINITSIAWRPRFMTLSGVIR